MTLQTHCVFSETNLQAAEKLRSRWIRKLVPKYRTRTLLVGDDSFYEFIADVAQLSPAWMQEGGGINLRRSLEPLLGKRLSREDLETVFWRLSGNLETLRMTHLPVWTHQRYSEWVYAEIVRVALKRGGVRDMQLGHTVTFQLLSGSPCPAKVVQWWSKSRSHYFAHFRNAERLGFGFVRQRTDKFTAEPPKYPFSDARQFVGMRCLLLITPELSTSELSFDKLGFTAVLARWNAELRRNRSRLTPATKCPRGVDVAVPCHFCAVGRDHCRCATHAKTYEFRTCLRCEKRAAHDPENIHQNYCLTCVERETLSLRQESEKQRNVEKS